MQALPLNGGRGSGRGRGRGRGRGGGAAATPGWSPAGSGYFAAGFQRPADDGDEHWDMGARRGLGCAVLCKNARTWYSNV